MKNSELIALNSKVFHAREEWHELTEKHLLYEKNYQGKSERSKQKTIYFVKRGKWVGVILRKISYFQNKFQLLDCVGSMKPKRLWLPTIIENADEVTVVFYAAISQRQLSPKQTIKYTSKHNIDNKHGNDKKNYVRTHTGRNYKIRVMHEGAVKYYPFTEWVICLCKNNELPIIKNIKNKGRD